MAETGPKVPPTSAIRREASETCTRSGWQCAGPGPPRCDGLEPARATSVVGSMVGGELEPDDQRHCQDVDEPVEPRPHLRLLPAAAVPVAVAEERDGQERLSEVEGVQDAHDAQSGDDE